MVTPEGRVKILDFGLARVQEDRGPASSGSQTVTVGPETPHPTSPGMVVGTVAYMSPEQASGHTVDYRSDQFSLGLVLYEMLARRRAFEGKSTAQTMAAIIEDEAPPLPAGVPTQVRWLLNRCLAKEPARRYASTLDLARSLRQLAQHVVDLTSASGEMAVAARRLRGWRVAGPAAWTVLLVLLLVSLRALYVDVGRVSVRGWSAAPFVTLLKTAEWPSWSPDGKSIAFQGWVEAEAGSQVWVQGIDAPTPVQLTHAPFVPYNALSWSSDSRMIYGPGSDGKMRGIFRIPAAGGEPVLVQPEANACTLSPDGRTLVMIGGDARVWYATPPDAPPRLYEPASGVALSLEMYPQIAFSPDGASVLVAAGECWLLPWPPGKGRRNRGLEDLPAGNGLSWMPDSRHVVSSSLNCLYMADVRTGGHWPILVSGTGAHYCSVSPDGSRIAYSTLGRHTDVIEMPLDGGPPRTLIGTRRDEAMPALSTSGQELAYCSTARGRFDVWSMNMESRSVRRLLTPGDVPEDSGSVATGLMNPVLSPDRRRLAVEVLGTTKGRRLYILFTVGGTPVRATDQADVIEECAPTWSPEGDRVAYLADRKENVFLQVVRPGGTDRPVQIWEGNAWGVLPAWSPTGEWIALADPSQVILVSPDGRAKRDLRCKRGDIAWAPDGRTLYVIHVENRHGWVGAIDIRTGMERRVRDLGDLVPDSFLQPGDRVSVTPDGKALVYATGQGGGDIFLLQGVTTPKPLYRRLWPW